jgi:hypothetical protein
VSLERAHAVQTEIEGQVRRQVPALDEVVARIVPGAGARA